jgi:hypothetical protein
MRSSDASNLGASLAELMQPRDDTAGHRHFAAGLGLLAAQVPAAAAQARVVRVSGEWCIRCDSAYLQRGDERQHVGGPDLLRRPGDRGEEQPSAHRPPPAPCSVGTGRPGTPGTHRPAAPQSGRPAPRNDHANRPGPNPQHALEAPHHRRSDPSRMTETRKITGITCGIGLVESAWLGWLARWRRRSTGGGYQVSPGYMAGRYGSSAWSAGRCVS